MEKKTMDWSVLAFGLVILVFSASLSHAKMSCTDAVRDLIPCGPFLVGFGPEKPSIACCMGAEQVFEQANTTAARRDLCNCFKNAASAIGALPERAEELPKFCKIHVTVPIGANVNCSKVP